MTTTEVAPEQETSAPHQVPWLLRDPLRTGFIALLLLSLAVR